MIKNTLNQDMAIGQNPDGTMVVWLYIDIYEYRRSDPPIYLFRLNYVRISRTEVIYIYTHQFDYLDRKFARPLLQPGCGEPSLQLRRLVQG